MAIEKRPLKFEDFIGQENIKKQLEIAIKAAKSENKALPHILLSGPPGLGKTTLAQIVANEMNVKCITTMAGKLKDDKAVTDTLLQVIDFTGYDEETAEVNGTIIPNILFADEIHELPIKAQEALYPILEDFIVMQQDSIVNPFTMEKIKVVEKRTVPYFTLIGATTESGDLARPFRDRFGLRFQLIPYTQEETVKILKGYCDRINCIYDINALEEIAARGRGVARIALNLLARCRDYCISQDFDYITLEAVKESFDILQIDDIGLGINDIKLLKYLSMTNRPIGINSLAEYIGETVSTLTDIIEPYLIKNAFIVRTSRGRVITELGKSHLQNRGDINKNKVFFGKG